MTAMRGLWKRVADRYRRRDRVREVSGEMLERWLADRPAIQLLDIRAAAAFHCGHLPGARHLPLERLPQEMASLDRSVPTVVY
jgi:rhodanese-related sulfurtransferase